MCVAHVRSQLSVSVRRACVVVGQSRETQRRQPKVRGDEPALTEGIVRLATQYGRYGYRRIRCLLLDEGWSVSVKRVYRIWQREGLKVPQKQPKRGRLCYLAAVQGLGGAHGKPLTTHNVNWLLVRTTIGVDN